MQVLLAFLVLFFYLFFFAICVISVNCRPCTSAELETFLRGFLIFIWRLFRTLPNWKAIVQRLLVPVYVCADVCWCICKMIMKLYSACQFKWTFDCLCVYTRGQSKQASNKITDPDTKIQIDAFDVANWEMGSRQGHISRHNMHMFSILL